jgi:hypothetical protein
VPIRHQADRLRDREARDVPGLLDYKPSERAKYIEAFFENIDWTEVGERLTRTGRTGK